MGDGCGSNWAQGFENRDALTFDLTSHTRSIIPATSTTLLTDLFAQSNLQGNTWAIMSALLFLAVNVDSSEGPKDVLA